MIRIIAFQFLYFQKINDDTLPPFERSAQGFFCTFFRPQLGLEKLRFSARTDRSRFSKGGGGSTRGNISGGNVRADTRSGTFIRKRFTKTRVINEGCASPTAGPSNRQDSEYPRDADDLNLYSHWLIQTRGCVINFANQQPDAEDANQLGSTTVSSEGEKVFNRERSIETFRTNSFAVCIQLNTNDNKSNRWMTPTLSRTLVIIIDWHVYFN